MRFIKFSNYFIIISFFTHNLKAEYNQQSVWLSTPEKNPIVNFLAPIQFTQIGIENFLSRIFNDIEYSNSFLPYNLCHLTMFLDYGKKVMHSDPLFMEASLRLFLNGIKRCRYISPQAYNELLEQLPDLMQNSVTIEQNESFMQHVIGTIKSTLYKFFLSKFHFFKQNPDDFFNDLSQEILTVLEQEISLDKKIDQERMRNVLVRLLETTTGKLIWSPLESTHAWDSFKLVANNLEYLCTSNIIGQEDLNDLLHSLVERYVYFMKLSAHDLNPEALSVMKNEVLENTISWLEIEEQEYSLTTKRDRLMTSIIEAEALILANNNLAHCIKNSAYKTNT